MSHRHRLVASTAVPPRLQDGGAAEGGTRPASPRDKYKHSRAWREGSTLAGIVATAVVAALLVFLALGAALAPPAGADTDATASTQGVQLPPAVAPAPSPSSTTLPPPSVWVAGGNASEWRGPEGRHEFHAGSSRRGRHSAAAAPVAQQGGDRTVKAQRKAAGEPVLTAYILENAVPVTLPVEAAALQAAVDAAGLLDGPTALFTPEQLPHDVTEGLIHVPYPAPRSWQGQGGVAAFDAAQAAHQAAAQQAVILATAPRILRSTWQRPSQLWGSSAPHLSEPVFAVLPLPGAAEEQMRAECAAHVRCDGWLPEVGLLGGVSALIQPAQRTPLQRRKQSASGPAPVPGLPLQATRAQLARVLMPSALTSSPRLLRQREAPSSPLHSFVRLPFQQMHLPGVSLVQADGRTPSELQAAQQCLDRVDCVGFSLKQSSLFVMTGGGSEASTAQGLLDAVAQPAATTASTRSVAQLLAAASALDQQRSAVYTVFLRLPDLGPARQALSELPPGSPAASTVAAFVRLAATLAAETVTRDGAWEGAQPEILPPDQPCGAEGKVPHHAAVCGRRKALLEVAASGAVPPRVLQAMRDVAAAAALVGAPLDYALSTVVSLLREAAFCSRPVHLYVGDASHLQLEQTQPEVHAGLHTLSLLLDPSYAARFGTLAWFPAPCATLLHSWQFPRLHEEAPPPHGWGRRPVPSPQVLPNGKMRARRAVRRGLVQQTLDVTSVALHAAARSQSAAFVLWEDDCFACDGALGDMAAAEAALAAQEGRFGAMKVGNGGSGIQVGAPLTWPLLAFMLSRRGSENVDVLSWQFLKQGGLNDFLAVSTASAHRGRRTSLKPAASLHPSWGRVECGNALDHYWGTYAPCIDPRLSGVWLCGDNTAEGRAVLAAAAAKDMQAALTAAAQEVPTGKPP